MKKSYLQKREKKCEIIERHKFKLLLEQKEIMFGI